MTFDLEQRSKVIQAFLSNISKTMRYKDFNCIVDMDEIMHGLSFGAMTFDLERSKVKWAL